MQMTEEEHHRVARDSIQLNTPDDEMRSLRDVVDDTNTFKLALHGRVRVEPAGLRPHAEARRPTLGPGGARRT